MGPVCIILGIVFLIFITFGVFLVLFQRRHDFFKDAKDGMGVYINNSNLPLWLQPLSPEEKRESLYSPFVIRPLEHSGQRYGGECQNILYPLATSPYGKGEMAAPCCPENEAKYYAQRPLIPPNSYHKKLKQLFRAMREKVPEDIPKSNLRYPETFLDDHIYTSVMQYIMGRMNKTAKELPSWVQYAKNDTWGGEQFAYLYEKVYSFTNRDFNDFSDAEQARITREHLYGGPKRLIVTFTLLNTTRTVSTDVIAVVYTKNNYYYLESIKFANKEPTDKIKGQALESNMKQRGINLNNEGLPMLDAGPKWIYGNTIENKFFNNQGFYDSKHPENNVYIEGGVPKEFEGILNEHEQAYLLKPSNGLDRTTGTQKRFENNLTTETNTRIVPDFPRKNKVQWQVKV
jgi:hypothetical protein